MAKDVSDPDPEQNQGEDKGSIPESSADESQNPESKKSPLKIVTVILLIFAISFFIWYVLSDRNVPYTDQARINGLMIPISPRVSGNLTRINVHLHSQVNPGTEPHKP
jgi:multidrug resistance efflux pump